MKESRPELKSDVSLTLMSVFKEQFAIMENLEDVQGMFPDFYNDYAVQVLNDLTNDLTGLNVGSEEYCDQMDRISDIIILLNESERAIKKPLTPEEAERIVLKQQSEEPHDE